MACLVFLFECYPRRKVYRLDRVDRLSSRPFQYPQEGFLSDERIVGAVAFAYLTQIIGEDKISKCLPLRIQLHDETWVVETSIPKSSWLGTPHVGGVVYLELNRVDGRITRIEFGL